MTRWNYYLIGLPFVAQLLTGCAVGPDYVRPELDLPATFKGETSPSTESIANLEWWNFFKDPQLQGLIRIALDNNYDLSEALSRIAEARATLRFTRADQFPFIDLSGSAARADSGTAVSSLGVPFNDFAASADLTFEVDLWGRYRRATEAERAQLIASEYSHRAVTISLLSQVAQTYFLLSDLDRRVQIARLTEKNRGDATKLIRTRFEKGIIPLLDVNQAEIEEADASIRLATFERERRAAENALGVLLGRAQFRIERTPDLVDALLAEGSPQSFPAELLKRRPDVLLAENLLHAEIARIGVAEAQRLPSIGLFGSIGTRSSESSNLFSSSDSLSWAGGGGIFGPLLNYGQNEARVEIFEARAQQAEARFKQSVIQAVREVEDALIAAETYRREQQARTIQVRASTSAAKLSRARYNDGVAPYLEVLDSERSEFDAKLGESASQQLYLGSLTQLYKALGGGW